MATRYSLVVPVYRNEDDDSRSARRARATRTASSAARSRSCSSSTAARTARSRGSSRRCRATASRIAKLLEMSRNFGAFAAIRAGLIEARGPYFAVMAADLQEPPELVARVLPQARGRELRRRRAACAQARDDPLRRARGVGAVLGASIAGSCSRRCRRAASTCSAATSARATQLVAFSEAHSSLVGQLFWIGMRRERGAVSRAARAQHGTSAGRSRKKLTYMLDSMSRVLRPADPRCCSASACSRSRVALVYGAVVLVARLTGLISEPGYATTVLLIACFGALNALGLRSSARTRGARSRTPRRARSPSCSGASRSADGTERP